MKIEKLSENRIRCILTPEDLASRQIKLSELAYGTDKARQLFHEMLQEASEEYGFETANTPIMIEAIPMRGGSIVLIVTKSSDVDMDPRYANFSPASLQGTQNEDNSQGLSSVLGEMLHALLETMQDGEPSREAPALPLQNTTPARDTNHIREQVRDEAKRFQNFAMCNRLYLFPSMDDVLQGAKQTGALYTGESLLFRENNTYGLLLKMKDLDEVNAMQYTLATLSEYGDSVPVTSARRQYAKEHNSVLIGENALQKLSSFS